MCRWCRVLPGDHLKLPERWREPGAVVAAGRWEHLPDTGSQRGKESWCFSFHPMLGSSPFRGCGSICTCQGYWGKGSPKKLLTEQVCTGGSTLICFTELVESSHFLPQSHAGRRFSVRNFILSLLKMNLVKIHYLLVYNMLLEPIGKAQGKLLSLSMQSTL